MPNKTQNYVYTWKDLNKTLRYKALERNKTLSQKGKINNIIWTFWNFIYIWLSKIEYREPLNSAVEEAEENCTIRKTITSEYKWNWNDLFQMYTMEKILYAWKICVLTTYVISFVDFRLVCNLTIGRHFSADYKTTLFRRLHYWNPH